jgi:hypothetical protein
MKIKMVCSTCQSEDVLCDAYASWDIPTQQWELSQTFDKGAYCNNCDGGCRIDEVEIPEPTKGQPNG